MVHSGASGRLAAHSETRVVLQRWVRKGFRDTRRSPKGFERGCSDVARPEGGSRKGLREGCCGLAVEGVFRRSLVPKGVFEGGFQEGLPRGCFGEFPRGCLRRRLRRGLPEGFPV